MHAKIARLGLSTSTANTKRPIGTKTTLALGCVALRQSHTWSTEPRHFQWSWTTPNPHFKVRSYFDAEYLRNG